MKYLKMQTVLLVLGLFLVGHASFAEEEIKLDDAIMGSTDSILLESPSMEAFTMPEGYNAEKDGFEVENEKLRKNTGDAPKKVVKRAPEPKRKPASVGAAIPLKKEVKKTDSTKK